MKRNLFTAALALLFAVSVFAGCSKKIVKTDESAASGEKPAEVVQDTTVPGPASAPAEQGVKEQGLSGAAASSSLSPEAQAAARAVISNLADVYFDFDRYTIREDSKKILEQDAKILNGNKGLLVVIEGRCDERGSSEYNLVLGERRAAATKEYLKNLGVDHTRLSTVSYGNEKPFCNEHNEACWQKNRTAHFVSKD